MRAEAPESARDSFGTRAAYSRARKAGFPHYSSARRSWSEARGAGDVATVIRPHCVVLLAPSVYTASAVTTALRHAAVAIIVRQSVPRAQRR